LWGKSVLGRGDDTPGLVRHQPTGLVHSVDVAHDEAAAEEVDQDRQRPAAGWGVEAHGDVATGDGDPPFFDVRDGLWWARASQLTPKREQSGALLAVLLGRERLDGRDAERGDAIEIRLSLGVQRHGRCSGLTVHARGWPRCAGGARWPGR